jgi:hypothetical protein
MLLVVGEIGRRLDLSAFPAARDAVINALSTGADEVQATATLALGGVAVGSLAGTLPLLLERAAEAAHGKQGKQLYLLLRSLNEVLRSLLAKGESLSPGMARRSHFPRFAHTSSHKLAAISPLAAPLHMSPLL